MVCTTPRIPPAKAKEVAKFSEQFGKQVTNFTKTLHLPSAIDPSVLSYKSRTQAYNIADLEDSKIVQSFVQDSVDNAIRGSITVDTSPIVKDVSNFVNALVGAAKTTPAFSGFSSTTYPGTFSGKDVLYKVVIAVYTADVSKLYESKPTSVYELAYYAFLTVQKANK